MNKQYYKDRIYGYECKAVSEITTALFNHEPKRTVLARCKKILKHYTVLLKLDALEYHSLWNWTVNTYRRISRQTWGKREQAPAVAARQYRALSIEKNDVANHIEFRFKHDRAMSYINSQTVFFQLSTHENPADGHEPYQGHLFINEDVASAAEKKFAEKNGILPIRAVMFDAPWLTTRTNCKHFFIPVPTDQVLNGTLPEPTVVKEKPLNTPYRAYQEKKKLLIAAGISKENDSYKRTVSLIKKYKLR